MKFPELPPEEAPELPVSFHFEDVPNKLPDLLVMTAWVLSVGESEDQPIREIHFIFCSDEYLLTINREHLQHDYYTDVITFPHADGPPLQGDIFISIERVEDNARQLGLPFWHELGRVMVHGVLHLAGYGDKNPEAEAEMRERENFYLENLRLPA
jgi:probable rRNA maturation factor